MDTRPVSERDAQRLVIDRARRLGWRVAHFHPLRTDRGWATPAAADGKGFPDLVLVHPERGVLFAELKVRGGLPSDAQIVWLEAIRAAGGRAYLWDYPADWWALTRILSGDAV